MKPRILRKYTDGEFEVTEYTKDGKTVTNTVRVPIVNESQLPGPPSLDETAEETLLETKYQTLLLEMMI